MQANLLKQYSNIRETIIKNVETIKMMVDQTKGLRAIAETLSSFPAQSATKASLDSQVEAMNRSINDLIDQTTELFRLYDEFAKEIFGS